MISVVVPVYKSEKTLKRCVDSLLAQKGAKLEVLLVDDGSPDACPALCDAYAGQDARVRVLHKENGGVSSARNAGIQAARGTYVAFVDSDDYVEPEYLSQMLQAVEKAHGQMAICGYHHHYAGADVEKVPGSEKDLLKLYETGFLNMPWNKLFVREKMGSFPEDLSLGEDLLFNLDYLRGLKEEEIVLVEAPLIHYIQEESGQTLSSQKRADKLELAKRIRREAEKFFLVWEGTAGQHTGSREYMDEIRRVVDTRFLCECLDDIERLPFDKTMGIGEKLRLIRDLSRDKEVQQACVYGKPGPLDYRIIQGSLRLGLIYLTYFLSVLRSLAVGMKRRMS